MNKIICGDALTVLRTLPDKCCRCCVTSPPYFNLRDYGVPGQIGLEPTMQEYIARLVEVFAEVKRVLTDDGTLWINIADSYAGSGKGAARYPENAKNINRVPT
jgi:DNA modification methylase|nr:MAG TPA: adenine-specific methyltransferase [Caudoviricetes sp.]